jgi:hypothetical protein
MNKRNYENELMEAIAPFVADYQEFPCGFAETDNLNDINECQKIVNEMLRDFNVFYTISDKKWAIKEEKNRWEQEKNAWCYGRYIARLNYLKNNKN